MHPYINKIWRKDAHDNSTVVISSANTVHAYAVGRLFAAIVYGLHN
jgi:hypothetical protein